MIRLLIVTPSVARTGGGVPEAVRQLAKLLKHRSDVQLRVLALADGPVTLGEAEGWDGIDVRIYRSFGPASYAFSPGLAWALLRTPGDVIHVHGIWKFHCLAAYLASLLRGLPYVVTPHGMMEKWIRARSVRLKAMVSRLYQDRFLKRAFAFHILTEKERGDVAEMVGPARCLLLPNFVEPARGGETRPAWWRPELDGRDIYLFFGRLHEKKGVGALIDAWEAINAADETFRRRSALIFCGQIDGVGGFEARVAELSGRFGNIDYAGPQFGAQKARSLAAASFLCLPSKSEGLPMTILEGWAAGVPAIMTPECNLAVGFERDSALSTTTDADGIAASLRAASALTPGRRRQMSSNAKALIADQFSPAAMETGIAGLYEEAIRARRA